MEISFEEGIPIELDGERMPVVKIIENINKIAGEYGIGRIDHIENRLVGIKTREVYEAPAALILIKAHSAIESLVHHRELNHFKRLVEEKYSEIVYYGLWFDPLREALQSFIEKTQERVTGKVRIKLEYDSFTIVGKYSPFSLYDYDLATYDKKSSFSIESAVGFIKLFGLPSYLYAQKGKKDRS
jgi:argininosuccinate synthase